MKKCFDLIDKTMKKLFIGVLISTVNLSQIVNARPGDGLTSEADTKFTLIINTIADYGFKFGLLIIFYGAIQIGLSFKNDNPDGKVQGARTAVAGLIVAAVSAGADKFFV